MDSKLTAARTEPEISTLRASYELATTPALVVRVRAAAVKGAIAVAAEAPNTANHARRLQLASQVLMSPGRWAEIMAEGVAANGSVVTKAMANQEIPDGDIEYTVNSLWDAYAGSDGGGERA